jgi:hypothetical protein
MKKFFFLLLILSIFAGCKKVEIINLTGTLRVECKVTTGDYENVQIGVFPYEGNHAIEYGSPNADGIYEKELLQGNYTITISYKGTGSGANLQIINGNTSKLSFEF